MLLARAALLVVLACSVAQGSAPTPAECDSFPVDRAIERVGMRLHALHERCTWTDLEGEHTRRVARVDVLRVDPAVPNGATHVVALVVASERIERIDFSYTIRHEATLFIEGAINATAAYDGVQDAGGARCDADARASSGIRDAAFTTPVPRCHPRSFPLP